jgi:hypothetical protein
MDVQVRELCGTINKNVDLTHPRRRTVVEQGNPDRTLVLLLKGLEQGEIIRPRRKDKASTYFN